MNTTTHKTIWAAAAVAALAIAAPTAQAAQKQGFVPFKITGGSTLGMPLISPPPKLSGRSVHWFRWHPSSRQLQSRAAEFGSAAVIGLESMRDLAALRQRYGFDRVLAIPELHAAEVSVTPAQLRALLGNAPSDERVRYVSPLGPTRKLLRLRNDPMLRTINPAINAPYEWQFAATHMDRALNLSQGSPMILTCTIDSGVADVPDLAGKIDGRWSFVGQSQTPVSGSNGTDVEGHGTAVASLIAANNDDGFGMAGFGGATHVVTFRDDVLADVTIALALAKLTRLGCRIVNMSLGGPDPLSPILKDALDRTSAAGVLIVAAAGNDSADSVSYPAADLQPAGGAPSLGLAVGSSDFAGKTSSFSNTGQNLSLLAPGDYDDGCSGVLAAIPSTSKMFDGTCYPMLAGDRGSRYASVAGTSFSAPEVAGVAALVWAARPDLDSSKVTEIIKLSARREGETWTPQRGFGVLDAAAALELATRRSSADALSVTSFRASRVVRRLTATGRVVWTDGVAVEDASVDCSAKVGGIAIPEGSVTLAQGIFSCGWTVPRARAGKLLGNVTVTDAATGVKVSRPFSVTLGR
jgi:serine protease